MEKKRRNFTRDEWGQPTREHLAAEGVFLDVGGFAVPVSGPDWPHGGGRLAPTPIPPSHTAGDPLARYGLVSTTASNMTSTPTPQLDTPYARLAQALWDHRLALTGTDELARLHALSEIWGLAMREWEREADALFA